MNFKTVKITLRDGREAVVMPYSIDAMDRLADAKALENVTSDDPKARSAAMRLLAYEAICESLPDVVKAEDIGRLLTMPMYEEITDAIALVNGWRATRASDAAPGEADSPSTPLKSLG
jgi:hypothetical protein